MVSLYYYCDKRHILVTYPYLKHAVIFSACGRTLQEFIGTFSHSPAPEKEELCQWRISATHGEKIVLNITALDIPVTGHSDTCDTDYLEVRDGHYVMSKLIGRVGTM